MTFDPLFSRSNFENVVTQEWDAQGITKPHTGIRRTRGPIWALRWACLKRRPIHRAANQYGISVFCTDFTCKIREYEFGLENTEIELCQFCHLKYCCQNKAYLFWVANQSGFVAFYALEPSNTSLITKTFNLLSSTCSSSMLSCLTSCSCSTGSIH